MLVNVYMHLQNSQASDHLKILSFSQKIEMVETFTKL